MKMTKHAKDDRMERLSYIVDCFNGDFGYEVAKIEHKGAMLVLMSCGVIFVKSIDETTLVTGYIATMKEATRIYRNANMHAKNMPDGVYKKILKNRPLYENQPQGKDIQFFQRGFKALLKKLLTN